MYQPYDGYMIRAIAIIGVAAAAVGVIIYSFFDCLRSNPRDIRGIKRGPWIAVILLIPVIGGVLWLTLGRPRYSTQEPLRGRGPDDDPTFLRQLDEKRRSEQADAELDAWEQRRRTERADGGTNHSDDSTQEIPDAENNPDSPGEPPESPTDPDTPRG